MPEIDFSQLIEEMTQALQTNADLSVWKKNRKAAPLLSVLTQLHQMPVLPTPPPDLTRVRNQILNRIAQPLPASNAHWLRRVLPKALAIGVGTLGTFLIVISLGLGTAVAALESVPGQTIYPLKKAVETVQLHLAPDDQKTSLQLKFANRRVDELQQIIEQKDQGKISDEEAQKVISETVKNLKQTTDAAAIAAASEPKIVDKLADLSNQIQSASTQTDGDAKVELEKAAANTQLSQKDAIKNMENAGLQVENKPITIPDAVLASGKLTSVTNTSVSIGTAKFLLSDTTEYVGLTAKDLTSGLVVDIEGATKDNKTYAVKITLILDPAADTDDGQTSGATTSDETVITPTPTPSLTPIPTPTPLPTEPDTTGTTDSQ